MTFAAGDIQTICDIDKTRYTYILRQVGIEPETEVEGTGRSHQYSFKNLLQFAISNKALKFLSAKEVRFIIWMLDKETDFPDIFEQVSMDAKLYYAETTAGIYTFYLSSGKTTGAASVIYHQYKKPEESDMELKGQPHDAEAHQIQHYMLNVGNIKDRVLKRI